MKHKISGLGSWEDLKIPAISGLCSTTQNFGLVWHLSDVVVLDFKLMRAARTISTGQNSVDFAHISHSKCFLVCQDEIPSTIKIFDINTTECQSIVLPEKMRCTYVEHIDNHNFLVGTDQGSILIYVNGDLQHSKELTETEKTSVTCIKFASNELGMIAAVGLGTGDIVVIELTDFSEFRLPDYRQKGGKVTGIEFITNLAGLFLAVFREDPSSFTVIQIAEESNITEIARIDYPKYASLLQMTLFENSILFLATLAGTELEISVYHPLESQTELITLEKKDFLPEELLTDLTIAIPEQSIYHNKAEVGCDIWILGHGGSELQVTSVCSSSAEKITQKLVSSCMDNTIWQKPELLERILDEYEQAGIKGPVYYENLDNLSIISILIKEKKSNVVSEFMVRKFQENYYLPDDYISVIEAWLKKDMIDLEEEVKEIIIDDFLALEKRGKDLYQILKHTESILSHCYQIKDIAVAIDMRKNDSSYIENILQKMHVLKFICWILRSDSAHYLKLEGWNWSERRYKRNELSETKRTLYMNSYQENGLMIDHWVNNRPFPPTLEQLIEILNDTYEKEFQAIYHYLLLDLADYAFSAYDEEIAKNIRQICASFKAFFLHSAKESYRITGFWHLDMLSDSSCYTITDEPTQKFYHHAKSALYALYEAKDILTPDEKKRALKGFYETSAFTSALMWGRNCQLNWNDVENLEIMLLTFFDANMWIQAFGFLNSLNPDLDSMNHGISLFIHLMETKNNTQYLPFIPFTYKLAEIYLCQLCNLLPQIYIYALIFRKRYTEAFIQEDMLCNEKLGKVVNAFKDLMKDPKIYDYHEDEIYVQPPVVKVSEYEKPENNESESDMMHLAAPHPEASNLSISASSIRPTKLSFTPRNS